MGISQLLTDSISKLTAKFQCKNCLYPSGSVEHSTQWLLCLLPCQGTVPNLTPSAVILSLEKPKRALPSVLSPLLQVTSSQAVRGAAAHMPESQCYSQILSASLHSNSSSQNPCQTPEQPAPHRQTPHPSLPLLANTFIYQGRKKREWSCSHAAAEAPVAFSSSQQHQPSPPVCRWTADGLQLLPGEHLCFHSLPAGRQCIHLH